MTRKDLHMISIYKNEAYNAYLEFLVRTNEVPRIEVFTLIQACNDLKGLDKSIEILKRDQ